MRFNFLKLLDRILL